MTGEFAPQSRFYDGSLYARLLDPFLNGLHGLVAALVKTDSRVLEVGCGTGNLSFRIAPKAAEVVGVELSPAMVDHAKRRSDREAVDNVSFLLGDVRRALADRPEGSFDVATMVLVLHEMPTEVREPALREVARCARRILCVDFRVPMPRNLAGLRNRCFEMAAGREHFGAFRDFTRRGGIPGIAEAANLKCRHLRFVDAATLDVCEVRRYHLAT